MIHPWYVDDSCIHYRESRYSTWAIRRPSSIAIAHLTVAFPGAIFRFSFPLSSFQFPVFSSHRDVRIDLLHSMKTIRILRVYSSYAILCRPEQPA